MRLLNRFRSLHDAFAAQQRSTSWEVPLGPKELRSALGRVSEGDVDELFAAVGMNWNGSISLAAFFQRLVHVTPESLIWELRCRLVCSEVWHQERLNLPELLKRISPSHAKRCSNEAAFHGEVGCPVASQEEGNIGSGGFSFASDQLGTADTSAASDLNYGQDTSAASDLSFGQDEWVDLCISIGLAAYEGNRLYHMLRDEKGRVPVSGMSDTIRVVVTPTASLMQLSVDVLERYGTFRDAFAAACTKNELELHFHDFEKLASNLQIAERDARKLWRALASSLSAPEPSSGKYVTEDQFVRRLVRWTPDMLPWATNTMMQALEKQFSEHFNSLEECRRSLRQKGLPSGMELSSQRLRNGLATVGVQGCDVDVVLSKARSVSGLGSDDHVTFDDVVEAMRSSWLGSTAGEHDILEKEGMWIWQQLHEDQHYTRQRFGDSLCRPREGSHVSLAASPSVSSRSTSAGGSDAGTASRHSSKSSVCSIASGPSLPPLSPAPRLRAAVGGNKRSDMRALSPRKASDLSLVAAT